MTRLVGREGELAALRDALFRSQSVPCAILLRGDAGMGKTTVLRRFAEEATDAIPLQALEFEADVDYALVDQLFRAVGAQATPLAAAASHVDVGLELLTQLGARRTGEPLAIIVDDAHWADLASIRALSFALRRLTDERVLMILATRDDETSGLPDSFLKLVASRGTILSLRPFEEAELAELARRHGLELSARELSRFRELTDGIPLHACALIEEVAPEEWLDPELPAIAPRSLANVVARRVRRLPDDGRRFVETLAVIGVPCDLQGAAAVAGETPSAAATDAALATGLVVTRSRTSLGFAHPLYQAAAYEQIGPPRRSELHRRAAAVAEDRPVALRHLAAAAGGPDPDLVAELVALAHEQAAQRAWSASASTFTVAASVGATARERQRLRLQAVDALLNAGTAPRARRLRDEIERMPASADRDYVLAHLALVSREHARAQALIVRAWDTRHGSDDPELPAKIALARWWVSVLDLDWVAALERLRTAEAIAPPGSGSATQARFLTAFALVRLGRMVEARAALATLGEETAASTRGFMALIEGDLAAARAELTSAVSAALVTGRLTDVAASLTFLVVAEFQAGDWDAAVVAAERAVAAADEHELLPFVGWPVVAITASRGDWESAERYLRTATELASDCADHTTHLAIARAQIATEQGQADVVVAALEPVLAVVPREGLDEPGVWPWPELYANALVDLGRLAEADAFLTDHEQRAQRSGRRLPIARLARARGRLEAARGDADAATAAFERAETQGEMFPYEYAQAQAAYGAFLRRRNRRWDASARLSSACERFEALGARPALERCRRELQACGLRPVKRASRDLQQLTPQEFLMAQLVVAGKSNREIAAALTLSVRTVEYHLRNVYAKLGVRSRTQLAAVFRGHQPSASP